MSSLENSAKAVAVECNKAILTPSEAEAEPAANYKSVLQFKPEATNLLDTLTPLEGDGRAYKKSVSQCKPGATNLLDTLTPPEAEETELAASYKTFISQNQPGPQTCMSPPEAEAESAAILCILQFKPAATTLLDKCMTR